MAVVTRALAGNREIVSTQMLVDPSARPDWLTLIADVRGSIDNVPEAS